MPEIASPLVLEPRKAVATVTQQPLFDRADADP
jgi:hypothetical protein